MTASFQVPTGHVFRVEGKRGPQRYAKYRLADGRQVQKRLGPAWAERGRPPAGYFTKRRAEDWLRRTLEDITPSAVEAFQARLSKRVHRGRPITPRTRNKVLIVLHAVFARAKKVWGLPFNPAADIERHPDRSGGDIDVFSPEEVHALLRASCDERDEAIYATAAFAGLRMGELRALRWRDVDFPRSVIRVRASYAEAELSVPKSGKLRSVPMVDRWRSGSRGWASASSSSTTTTSWPASSTGSG